MKIAVIGAGAWGTVFGGVLRHRGHEVEILGRERDNGVVEDAELVVVAVPSRSFGEVVEDLPGSSPVLSLTKGLDPATGGRLTALVRNRPVAVLSGPNIAAEIAEGLPTAAVVASQDHGLAVELQHEINSMTFRVYVNNDPAGVEFAAAAKNVIALAAGAMDGLGLGSNAKAALITLGLADMATLGMAIGAQRETFAGLAGTGDLLTTCWSRHSRNRRAGALMARGASAADAVRKIGTVEGLTTAPILDDRRPEMGIDLPDHAGRARGARRKADPRRDRRVHEPSPDRGVAIAARGNTMRTMRLVWAALVSTLVLVAAGCGSENVGAGESAGAELLKPGALVYADLESDPESDQWKQVEELVRRFPDGEKWLAELKKEIESGSDITWEEAHETLGGDAAVAVYASSMTDVKVVALLRPDDVDEALKLIERLNKEEPDDPLVTRRVGDWIAASDKEASIDAALKAEGGQALSDDEAFQEGMAELPDDALGRVYVDVASAFETFGRGPEAQALRMFGLDELDFAGAWAKARDDGAEVAGVVRGEGADKLLGASEEYSSDAARARSRRCLRLHQLHGHRHRRAGGRAARKSALRVGAQGVRA